MLLLPTLSVRTKVTWILAFANTVLILAPPEWQVHSPGLWLQGPKAVLKVLPNLSTILQELQLSVVSSFQLIFSGTCGNENAEYTLRLSKDHCALLKRSDST